VSDPTKPAQGNEERWVHAFLGALKVCGADPARVRAALLEVLAHIPPEEGCVSLEARVSRLESQMRAVGVVSRDPY
jgi:hypothetical protein